MGKVLKLTGGRIAIRKCVVVANSFPASKAPHVSDFLDRTWKQFCSRPLHIFLYGFGIDLGELLGIKLVLNEFVAYSFFQKLAGGMEPRTVILATYALTGFANIASIGIQLGGIGAMAPSRRADLARLGPRALLTGFLVTLVNAAIAGVLL